MGSAPPAFGGYGGPMRSFGRMYGSLDYDDVRGYILPSGFSSIVLYDGVSYNYTIDSLLCSGVMEWGVRDLQEQIGGIGHTKLTVLAHEELGSTLGS